jgi:aldehyde dehydrogenase
MSIMVLMDMIGDLLPPGVLNVINGFGVEAGKPLAQNKRVAKVAFTGETTTGRLIMQYASDNIISVTLELGGKSPNIFFEDVAARDDDFLDKALEGFAMFAFNWVRLRVARSILAPRNSSIGRTRSSSSMSFLGGAAVFL